MTRQPWVVNPFAGIAPTFLGSRGAVGDDKSNLSWRSSRANPGLEAPAWGSWQKQALIYPYDR